ncbi:uncharacterized protein LOC101747773 isoform X1 [Gallus gallus]|uniref:uncharacterized protein LOC101747773 isoform X1 n=1 Tax=Gallus gallus TaxID=9031 RepID=UPI001AE4128E|nr:uncharacterized protein LOC101747773 isoform X1 [Gallus gallus]
MPAASLTFPAEPCGGALRRRQRGGGGQRGGTRGEPSRGEGERRARCGRPGRRREGREGLFRRQLPQVSDGVPVGVWVALRLAPIVTLSGLRPWHSLAHTHTHTYTPSLTHNRACCHRPPPAARPPLPPTRAPPPGRAASLAPAAAAGTAGKGRGARPEEERVVAATAAARRDGAVLLAHPWAGRERDTSAEHTGLDSALQSSPPASAMSCPSQTVFQFTHANTKTVQTDLFTVLLTCFTPSSISPDLPVISPSSRQ